MNSAGIDTPRQLAAQCGVSSKTVERWLKDEGWVPHQRNRRDACRVLGVTEDMIWPTAQNRVKTGTDREIVHAYPYRSAAPSTVWAETADAASEEIVLAGYTNYFFWTQVPQFSALLRRKASAGCRVRFLLGDPEGEVTRRRERIEDVELTVGTRIRMTLRELSKLGDVTGIEARFSSSEDAINHVSLSVFRFDHDAMVTPHLARLVGHDSPMLHLRRHGEGGMWSRFAEHTEELWERGVPVSRA